VCANEAVIVVKRRELGGERKRDSVS
jgi:hypothetical protein